MSQDSQAPLRVRAARPVRAREAVTAIGYETPSPIQAATIPAMLEGRDVLARPRPVPARRRLFALPVLSNIDQQIKPQA